MGGLWTAMNRFLIPGSSCSDCFWEVLPGRDWWSWPGPPWTSRRTWMKCGRSWTGRVRIELQVRDDGRSSQYRCISYIILYETYVLYYIIHIYIYTHMIYDYMYVCMYIYISTYNYIHPCLQHIHMCMYTYAYMCMSVYIYIHIRIHIIHTHIFGTYIIAWLQFSVVNNSSRLFWDPFKSPDPFCFWRRLL